LCLYNNICGNWWFGNWFRWRFIYFWYSNYFLFIYFYFFINKRADVREKKKNYNGINLGVVKPQLSATKSFWMWSRQNSDSRFEIHDTTFISQNISTPICFSIDGRNFHDPLQHHESSNFLCQNNTNCATVDYFCCFSFIMCIIIIRVSPISRDGKTGQARRVGKFKPPFLAGWVDIFNPQK
jgi:hypothetical protein